MKKKKASRRNFYAKAVKKLPPRIVPSKKAYHRKKVKKLDEGE